MSISGSPPIFTTNWFSVNAGSWSVLLDRMRGRDGVQVLEIGCFEGMSTCWLLDNILTGKDSGITVVDTFLAQQEQQLAGVDVNGLEARFDRNVLSTGRQTQVTKLVGESWKLLRRLDASFDLVYVDGSHKARDVLEDMILSWRLLKVGGLMICDDYLWNETWPRSERPGPAIDAFIELLASECRVISKGAQVAVERVA